MSQGSMLRRLIENRRNPLGIALGLLHAFLLVGVIFSRQPEPWPDPDCGCERLTYAGNVFLARRYFHPVYEPALVQFVFLTDTPSVLCAALLALPVTFLLVEGGVSDELLSYYTAAFWIYAGSIQWWAIGTWVYCRWKSH